MLVRYYQHGPQLTGGYRGWLETPDGTIVGFIREDWSIQTEW
jgi:hypothetical protein